MTSSENKKKNRRPLLLRILLVLLIGLPFALFFFLESGDTIITWVVLGIMAIAMAVLVWVG